MILSVIKKSAGDIWDELLYVVVFNVIWLVGSLLVIPWPFVTFGLFSIAHDIGQGKGIKFGAFFRHARRMWKPAYIWGGINLAVLIVLAANISFYGGIGTQWAIIARMLMAGIAVLWSILQLVALPLYPRLEEPGFRIAFRNAVIVVGRHPLEIFSLLIIVVLVGVISSLFRAFAFLAAFAIIAIVANRMVGAIVERETKGEEE